MRCIPRVLILATATLSMSGCAGHVGPYPIEVLVKGKFKSVNVGAGPVQLTADVKNDSAYNKGVSWTIMATGQNCSPACGTLAYNTVPSFSATYTPPSIIPVGPDAMPTITATSVTDPTKSYSFTFSIGTATPISLSLSGVFQTVDVGGPLHTLTAATNDPAGIIWSLKAGGQSCSPACGALVPSALPSLTAAYTPPIGSPTGSNSTPSITVTSITNPAVSQSFSFSMIDLPNFSYTFLLRGYDAVGAPVALAGSLAGDVFGHITRGELDINDGGAVTSAPGPLQGSYGTNRAFNGVIRGTIAITNFTLPGTSVQPSFRFVLSSDEGFGRIIEFDASGYKTTGTIQLQNRSVLGATPTGRFAFGLDSDAPTGGRVVEAGEFGIASGSAVSSGLVDQSKAGATAPIYSAASVTGGSATASDSSGRGLLSLVVGGVTTSYAYYVVNSSHLNLIEIDSGSAFGTVQAGTARAQSSLNADSVNATSILAMNGISPSHGSKVAIGLMTIGANTVLDSLLDTNNAGNVTTRIHASGTVTSFDPQTGRGTISIPGGFSAGFLDSAVFYLYAPGSGFIIDAEPSVHNGTTNGGLSGVIVQQSPGPFDSQGVSGNVLLGSGTSVTPTATDIAAAGSFDSGAGTLVLFGDLTSLNVQSGNAENQSGTGTYSITDSLNGYGTAMVPAGLFGDFTRNSEFPASFYMIGPNQFVLIGTQSGVASDIFFFNPF